MKTIYLRNLNLCLTRLAGGGVGAPKWLNVPKNECFLTRVEEGGGAGAGVKNNLDVRFGILMVMN